MWSSTAAQAFFGIAIFTCTSLATAQTPSIFVGSDLQLGGKLVAEHRCNTCHQNNVGGDGTEIYNPKGKINTAGKLRGMVEACNTQLNLALFPDEVSSIAAFLNRHHYKLLE